MPKSVWGILAHVDAGKTTLSEAMLYNSGKLKEIGRVDHGDAFLDTNAMEKNRGITIFSKPALFEYKDLQVTLLDTPGHVDFATEAERALWVLDYAILLISGADGVQGHTKTLFRLLDQYQVPTVIFINKIDQPGVDVSKVIDEIHKELSDVCQPFDDLESVAMNDEEAMDEFLMNDSLSEETMATLLNNRKWIPIFSGSALKNQGVVELMDGMNSLINKTYPSGEFGGKVYKIESLGKDTRLTLMKVTSGEIKVKNTLPTGEKVDQIRLYSGAKFSQVDEAKAGDVVALVGPKETYAGQGLGVESDKKDLMLTPVLEYAIEFTDDTVPRKAYPLICKLNEEDPSLHVSWDEATEQIKLHLMGEVQTEIITERLKSELGMDVIFSEGQILYKETICNTVEGVGHFEPLRHYAEVHLLMEPLEMGSGIVVATDVSTDDLALNWQRLITTHILEKEHVGVLTGSPITDMKITIIGGRAHIKHTEGGDFRESTYRAIRQGLMEAENQLLEPYFRFELTIPSNQIGRAMNDIEKMNGSFEAPVDNGDFAKITGKAPAICIRNYQAEVITYTKGMGGISLEFLGYLPCHNADEVLEASNYDPNLDIDNPAGSVFCSHGAGVYVDWTEVKEKCHVPCRQDKPVVEEIELPKTKRELRSMDEWLDPDEIDSILHSATHSNVGKNTKKSWNYGNSGRVRHKDSDYQYVAPKSVTPKKKYMLVDGYNLIYAWPELKEILDINLDGARGKLLDILSNYKGMTDYEIIAVFDAYKVKNHAVTAEDYLNIHQVFTAEAQTADAYIEKFTHEHGKKYDITVVTSDYLEQIIIRGAGARLISSREFIEEVARQAQLLREEFDIK